MRLNQALLNSSRLLSLSVRRLALLIVLQLFLHRGYAVELSYAGKLNGAGSRVENFLILFVRKLAHVGDRSTVVAHCVFNVHHLLVTLLSRHKLLNHCTVALIHRRLVWITSVDVVKRLIG